MGEQGAREAQATIAISSFARMTMTRSGGTSSDWQVGSSFVSGMLLHAIRLISPELRPLSLQCRLVDPLQENTSDSRMSTSKRVEKIFVQRIVSSS